MNRSEYRERFGDDLNNLMPTEITADGENYFTAWKMGARWVCDGPEGRFHAKTKQQLIEMLKNGGAVL